jgi:hypothetical protein
MDALDIAWLVPTLLEVIGLAIGLTVFGFGYEHAFRKRKSLLDELTKGHKAWWLALAGVIFTAGLCATRMNWGYKAMAVVLAVLLIGLARISPKSNLDDGSETANQSQTKRFFGGRLVKIILGVILVMILAWGIHLGWHTVHLLRLARDLQENLTQIEPDTIVPLIEDAAVDIGAIHQDLKPLFPIFNISQGIPRAGPYLGQIEPLVRYADGLTQAGKEIALGFAPLLEESPAGQASLSIPERVSQVVQSGQARFVRAAKSIDQASQVRSRIIPELLPTSVRPMYLKLDEKFSLLMAGVQALQAAPQLLGVGQPQSYLVLAQNRDELRATGGFISGIGLFTVQGGKILRFDLGDSYQIDDFSKPYPKPPEPLKRFMLADYWVTRDANWSPDFPTSSQEAQTLYTLSTGVQTQGVIAFNQLMVQKILEVIGPVQVPGTDEPVTSENVENYMRQAWAPAPEEGLSQEWWLHRKDFMKQLGSVILDKTLNSGDREQLLKLARTMVDLLDQGQLLLYFNDHRAQGALEAGGWDGALHPGRGDYLYLVDSNVGFNKVDSVIQRSLAYHVDLRDLNHPMGEVTLAYQHTGSGDLACKQEISYGNGTYQDMQQRCYLDYWRVYAPGGSELLASNAQPVPADELLNGLGWSGQVESMPGEYNTQVFAGLLMLPSSQSSQIAVTYSLPPSVVQSKGNNLQEYTIRVQVQPGLSGLPFQLEIKLPNNASLTNPGDGWELLTAQTWSWQGLLDKSTELNLLIQINSHP